MKDVNLVNTIPLHRQYEIRRWFIFSMALLGGTLITITILQVPLLRAWYSIKKEKENLEESLHVFENVMDKKHELKQQEKQLRNKKTKLEQYHKNPKNPIKQMQMIFTACDSTIELDGLIIQKSSFKITAACSQIEHATGFMQRLSQDKHVQNTKLVSMQQHKNNQTLHFTVHGKIKKT